MPASDRHPSVPGQLVLSAPPDRQRDWSPPACTVSRATSVWYAYEAAASFLWALPFTVTAYYFVTEVGMSPLELVLVGTVMELSVFVFEVPTGIVADTTRGGSRS